MKVMGRGHGSRFKVMGTLKIQFDNSIAFLDPENLSLYAEIIFLCALVQKLFVLIKT